MGLARSSCGTAIPGCALPLLFTSVTPVTSVLFLCVLCENSSPVLLFSALSALCFSFVCSLPGKPAVPQQRLLTEQTI